MARNIPIFGPNQFFLGWGGHWKDPPPYFAGAGTRWCRVWEPENGFFTPPPPRKVAFFAQKGAKNANFGPKPVVLGSGGQSKAPHPVLRVPNSDKHVLQGMRARKWVIQVRDPQKNGHFLPKKRLKMPILGGKQCFLGLGGQFKAPPPFFAGAQRRRRCVPA